MSGEKANWTNREILAQMSNEFCERARSMGVGAIVVVFDPDSAGDDDAMISSNMDRRPTATVLQMAGQTVGLDIMKDLAGEEH